MLDNPNVNKTSSIRRRSSVSSLGTLRRRSTLLTSATNTINKSSSCHSIEQQYLSVLPEVAFQCPNGLFTLRIVSSKLNKNNPYIGSFRHSPPTTFRDLRILATTTHPKLININKIPISPSRSIYYQQTSTGRSHPISPDSSHSSCRSGFSRADNEGDHSFPSKKEVFTSYLKLIREQEQKLIYFNKMKDANKLKDNGRFFSIDDDDRYYYVSGHLPGGGRDDDDNEKDSKSSKSVQFVASIASWLFQLDNDLPFTADEHMMVPKITDDVSSKQHQNDEYCCHDDGNSSDCESSVSLSVDDHCKDDCSLSANSSSCDDDEVCDESDVSSYDNYDTTCGSRTVPKDYYANLIPLVQPDYREAIKKQTDNENVMSSLPYNMEASSCLSVLSTQAEAYYAYNSINTQLGTSLSNVMMESKHNNQKKNPPGGSRVVNYETITQMDIVQMARIASKRLDVASIFQLPIITYEEKQKSEMGLKKDENLEEEDTKQPPKTISCFNEPPQQNQFSWIMVDESMPTKDNNNNNNTRSTRGHRLTTTKEEITEEIHLDSHSSSNDVCVICLEQFVQGDRLRVLPCHHAFHVKCIDPWLSGSHSFANCYTAGCPTCKKHPVSSFGSTMLDGAVEHQHCVSSNNNITTAKSSSAAVSSSSSRLYNNNNLDESTDGTLPSWAFAQIGVALARESK